MSNAFAALRLLPMSDRDKDAEIGACAISSRSGTGPSRGAAATFAALVDEILAQAGIQVVLSGIRMPRMNLVMERWVQTCRHELLDLP